MITFDKDIPLRANKTFYLVPIGDVHYNTVACDKPRFHRLIEWIRRQLERGDKVGIIGMGDYTDPMSTSERSAVRGAKGGQGFHDTTHEALDLWGKNLADEFINAVWPVKDCFIGLCEGHHYWQFLTNRLWHVGETSTQYISDRLGCKYFGTECYGELRFPHNLSFRVVAHHGTGSGRTKGARINRIDKFGESFRDADLVMMGHDHEKLAGSNVGFSLKRNAKGELEVDVNVRKLLKTGSFLRSFAIGEAHGGYAEQGAFNPVELGAPFATIRIEKQEGRWRLDRYVSL